MTDPVRVPVGRSSSFDELVEEVLAEFAESHPWTDEPDPTEDELRAALAEFQRRAGLSVRVDAFVVACWRFWSATWDEDEEISGLTPVAEQRPLPGDDGFLELLDQEHAAGRITARGRRQLRLVHLNVRRVRGRLHWLAREFNAGRLDFDRAAKLLYEADAPDAAHAALARAWAEWEQGRAVREVP